MDKRINYSHFKKLLTSQPYFIWHSSESQDLEDDEFDDDDNMQFFIPDFADLEMVETTFSEVQAKSFHIIEKKFEQMMREKNDNVHFVISKSFEDKIKETQEAMNNRKIDLIVNPLFVYQWNDKNNETFEVVATPKMYSKKAKEIINLKLSTSTKRIDALKMYYDAQILKKIGIPVDDLSLFILATQEYEKGQIDFFRTHYFNNTKSPKSNTEAKESLDYLSMQMTKAGMGGDMEKLTKFIDVLNENSLKISRSNNFDFEDMNFYIEKIVDAQYLTEICEPMEIDASIWASNKNWNAILEKYYPNYVGVNGKILTKKEVIEKIPFEELMFMTPVLNAILTYSFLGRGEVEVDSSKLKDFFAIISKLEQKVVWYDFEAFSLPICPLKGFLPFQQVVSQVSIIVTNNLKEIEKNNIVIDPKNIVLNDLFEIIKAIYKPNHFYVVYNKSYENTRLKEILSFLNRNENKNAEEARKMVCEIIENTIDLADFFITSRSSYPAIFIPDLKGKHSIKLLEKYITSKRPNLPYKIKEYKNLDIKNGMMAMECANNRALGIIGDQEWATKSAMLKEYCENDVRAMILVFYLIKDITKNNH